MSRNITDPFTFRTRVKFDLSF